MFILGYFTFISGYGILGDYFGIFAKIIMGYWDIRGVFKGYWIFTTTPTTLNKPLYSLVPWILIIGSMHIHALAQLLFLFIYLFFYFNNVNLYNMNIVFIFGCSNYHVVIAVFYIIQLLPLSGGDMTICSPEAVHC